MGGRERDDVGRVVVIGTFDGVHVGHRHLIARALSEAASVHLGSAIVTFDRHPAETVRPAAVPPLLTTVEHKLELLRATEIDEVVVLAFDAARAAETAEDFVRDVLVARLSARRVFVGASFRFGHRAVGDVQLLQEMGAELGFQAFGVPLFTDEPSHTIVSSTTIRALVAAGDLVTANRLLTRPHETRAPLVAGPGSRWALDVAAPLLLPPPGSYRADAGPLGAPLVAVRAVVRPSSPRVELEPLDADLDGRPGTTWRVRFLGG